MIQIEEFTIEIQVTGGGTGCPLAAHRPHVQPYYIHIELNGPLVDSCFKLVVALTWSVREVILYLNGKRSAVINSPIKR